MPQIAKKKIQAEAKRNDVINPQNYNLNFNTEKLCCCENATNQLKPSVELGYMWPRRLAHQVQYRSKELKTKIVDSQKPS